MDEDDSDSDSDRDQSPRGTFTEEAHETLRALYSRGMNGWGKKHSANINIAMAKTGLTLSQIKVYIYVASNFRFTSYALQLELDQKSKYGEKGSGTGLRGCNSHKGSEIHLLA